MGNLCTFCSILHKPKTAQKIKFIFKKGQGGFLFINYPEYSLKKKCYDLNNLLRKKRKFQGFFSPQLYILEPIYKT